MKLLHIVPVTVVTTLLVVGVYVAMLPASGSDTADPKPWLTIEQPLPDTDHASRIKAEPLEGLADGDVAGIVQAITAQCMGCHEEAAQEVMSTPHWTWLGDRAPSDDGGLEPVGKRNLTNNFCVSIIGNQQDCSLCHVSFGWTDNTFDFADTSNVDCIVCHDRSGQYRKTTTGGGLPRIPAGVDNAKDYLLSVARLVGPTSRASCDACHLTSGARPDGHVDVHLGEHQFLCTDCHKTENHRIAGRSLILDPGASPDFGCAGTEGCHAAAPHENDRLNRHTQTVACQSCHVPNGEEIVDLSMVNLDLRFSQRIAPEYRWYNGHGRRYRLGDAVDPEEVLTISEPVGDIRDPNSHIYPFKVFRRQLGYDREYGYLLVPRLVGPDGFWATVLSDPEGDPNVWWDRAYRGGAEATGLPYSGDFDWIDAEMYWPLSHVIAGPDHALQCDNCHGDFSRQGRIDWRALGYPGNAQLFGGRGPLHLLDE